MSIALDQPAQAPSTVHMGWANPPVDVTNAVSALQHQCEAWPKTPTNNPFSVVSGFEDSICQAVTGHALFVPEELACIIHEKCAVEAKPLISFTTMRMGCLMKFFAMKSLAQVFGGLGQFRVVR